MDNIRTGAFIKELRKEKGLTQKELADALHITDRAVSKWERGLCAPDISTLESLSAILGVTISEIICGERCGNAAPPIVEQRVQEAICYSEKQLCEKTQRIKKGFAATAAILVLIIAMATASILWWTGILAVEGRFESPDGKYTVTVYGRDVAIDRFASKDAVTIKKRGAAQSTVIYENCRFGGLWWSPDSTKYVTALEEQRGTRLVLCDTENHSNINMNAVISAGGGKDVRYKFLQWSADSRAILIYYSRGENSDFTEGYFWYDLNTWTHFADFEISK
ncbi:MAG: helix-turn-helix domain-containing protein [Oscillospiraceae bacterium]|nr:helix-turn-helix domain-containing protein [Oscillospiraceae bacterium]